MASCEFGFIGDTSAICLFSPNYCDFLDTCKPQCLAEVQSEPERLAEWRCRADVAQSGQCPQVNLTTPWTMPTECALDEGITLCDMGIEGCVSFCELARQCAEAATPLTHQGAIVSYPVLTDTRRLAELPEAAQSCELFCYGHAMVDPGFPEAAQCYHTLSEGECTLPLDAVDTCE